MTSTIPEDFERLLEEPVFPKLATVLPDGQPQVHPVWSDYDGRHIRINTAKGRQKDRNLRERKQATLLYVDPQDPYYWMEVRGRVVDVAEGDEAEDHIDDLAYKYMGEETYPMRKEDEVRVLYTIEPDRVLTYGSDE